MSVDAILVRPGDLVPVNIHTVVDAPAIVVMDDRLAHGVFKSGSQSGAGTTVIATPDAGGSLLLSDLLVSTDKQNATSVEIRFNDGTRAERIALFDTSNAPVTLPVSFTGKWQGWQDAWLEVVNTGAVESTVSVGYCQVPRTLSLEYTKWDAER